MEVSEENVVGGYWTFLTAVSCRICLSHEIGSVLNSYLIIFLLTEKLLAAQADCVFFFPLFFFV